jgi:hypothetical protein
MEKQKYTPYVPKKRNYPKLTEEQKLKLFNLQPSQSGELQLWPCRVVLKNGEVFDNVYITEAKTYFKQWGVWPEDDPGKKSIDISSVVNIEPSPNRLPAYLANKLYSAGESGMGFSVFKVVFSDNSEQVYVMGNAIDFLKLPPGKEMTDIIDVKSHEGREEKNKLEGLEFFWGLFEE